MFETFKLFEGYSIDIVMNNSFPKTIWQILNHLQFHFKNAEYNIDNLNDQKIANEDESWLSVEEKSLSQEDLSSCLIENERLIKVFENQLKKKEISIEDENKKREILVETALHLSFHLGEIALIRRFLNDYLNHEEANIKYLNEREV